MSVTESSQGRHELADSLFFGLLEGLCFFCLFIFAFVLEAEPLLGWLAIGTLRVVALAGNCLPTRGVSRGRLSETGDVLRFLGQGMLYQIPFWVSALLFPLQVEQARYALMALLLQSLAFALLPWMGRFLPWLGTEAIVFLLALAWLDSWQAALGSTLPALLAFPFVCRKVGHRSGWGWQMTKEQSLALALVVLCVFVLPRLGAPPSEFFASTILLWVMLLYLGSSTDVLRGEAFGGDEAELGLPSLAGARLWSLSRRSFSVGVGWMLLPSTLMQAPQEWLAYLVLWSAWWRALKLAVLGLLSSPSLTWWVAFEATLVWAVLRSTPAQALCLSVGSWLCCAALHLWHRESASTTDCSETGSLASLEEILRRGLLRSVPDDFKARLLQESAPGELDKSLTSTAPVGFRQRLLERLRKSDGEQDENQQDTDSL